MTDYYFSDTLSSLACNLAIPDFKFDKLSNSTVASTF